jgi:hypothetical protein
MPGTIGVGAQVEINDGASNAFAVWNDVLDIEPNDDAFNVQESKRLNITSRRVTKVLGVQTPGQLVVTYEFTKTEYTRIEALKTAMVAKSFKITLPEGSPSWTATFTGFITSNKIQQVSADGIMTVQATIEISA